jgi:uncharacterized protein (TIGR00369 family)
MLDEPGLTRFMATRVTGFDPDAQTLDVEATRRVELEGGAGAGHWHGGAIAALTDTAATFLVLGLGSPTAPTASMAIDLLRPATTATLHATARLRRMGRTLALVDVDAQDEAGRLVATGRLSFVVAQR